MPRAPSPRRYAQAVFNIALERNELDGWLRDLEVLEQVAEQTEFATFLEGSQIPFAKKLEVIREVLSDARPLARNLLSLLVTRGAVKLAPEILAHYRRLLDAHQGVARGEVITAVALPAHLKQQVADLLKDLAGKDVVLASRIEPNIIGGLIVRVEDRIIDGSTRTRLEDMRRNLLTRTS